MRGEVTAGGTSAMAAAHAQERAQTVQRSHPARQAGSAPKHPEEGAREVFIPLSASWRKGSCCQSPSLSHPALAAIPLRVPGAEGLEEG